MRILVIGDIVGKGARKAVRTLVPELRREYNCCFCIANGENSAGGSGLTRKCVDELRRGGIDVITSGDHIWRQKEFIKEIPHLPYVLRPGNMNANHPGKGYGIYTMKIGGVIGVMNLIGRVFMSTYVDNPFVVAERLLEKITRQTNIIFVDFHGEATSEKNAMGRFLDGRVTAVFGTHTHVPTADEQIFPQGTAFISDLGMVGGKESIIGRDITAVVESFHTDLTSRFRVVESNIVLNGAIIEFDTTTGKALTITRISRSYSP